MKAPSVLLSSKHAFCMSVLLNMGNIFCKKMSDTWVRGDSIRGESIKSIHGDCCQRRLTFKWMTPLIVVHANKSYVWKKSMVQVTDMKAVVDELSTEKQTCDGW